MLRARDFEPAAGLQHSTQKRRLRRQRFLETALPCALIAALLVAAVFTVGHVGAQTRNAARLRAARSTAMLEAEGATALSSSSTTLHDQLAQCPVQFLRHGWRRGRGWGSRGCGRGADLAQRYRRSLRPPLPTPPQEGISPL